MVMWKPESTKELGGDVLVTASEKAASRVLLHAVYELCEVAIAHSEIMRKGRSRRSILCCSPHACLAYLGAMPAVASKPREVCNHLHLL